MLAFQVETIDVPQPDSPLVVQLVQMDIPRSFFMRNKGANQLRIEVQESADGNTYTTIPGLEKTLDAGQAAAVLVESSYPFVRLYGNGNSALEVGSVGSFQTPPRNGLGLLTNP